MGASTVKIATYYEQVVRKKVGCRSNKSIKKRSYVGVGDIRGDVHICNNNMIEFGDLHLTVRASMLFMSYEKRTLAEEHHSL